MKLHLALILLPALTMAAAAAPTTQSGTRQASCVIDVWGNLNLNDTTVTREILQEMGPAAHDILGIAPETLQEYFLIQPVGRPPTAAMDFPDMGQTRMELSLSLDDKSKPAAREFLDKMIEALPGVIDRLQRRELELRLDQIMKARAAQADQQQRVKESEALLRSIGMGGRSLTDIRALVKGLDEQNQQLNLDVAALNAQRDVLAKTVERIGADASDKADADPVAKELDTIVKVKEKKLDMLNAAYKSGNASTNELADAEAAAAEARVQLLERRETVAHAAGGDAMADFKKQLVLVEVNLAQDKARLDAIEKQTGLLNQALQIYLDDAAASGRVVFNGRLAGEITDTSLDNIQRALDAIPRPAVRVVS